MSQAHYGVGGLRFWRQAEIERRGLILNDLLDTMEVGLQDLDPNWRFEQVDTPVIMPRDLISDSYTENDIFLLVSPIGGKDMALRAETTMGSYLVADTLMRTGEVRAPMVVWTAAQSFRRETNDGASPSKLRFNAFYQAEFQCIFNPNKTANPAAELRESLRLTVERVTGLPARLIPSDRRPSYSEETIDIEVEWTRPNASKPEWKEVASTSIRKDFPTPPGHQPYKVFEVAFGLDRMVAVSQGTI